MDATQLLNLDAATLAEMATEAPPEATATIVATPLATEAAPEAAPQPLARTMPSLATARKPRGRATGGKGGAKKDDVNNSAHLTCISGKKGPNGLGTVIYVWCVTLGTWFEVPNTKAKEAFASARNAKVNARIYIETSADKPDIGQRYLFIG